MSCKDCHYCKNCLEVKKKKEDELQELLSGKAFFTIAQIINVTKFTKHHLLSLSNYFDITKKEYELEESNKEINAKISKLKHC